MKKLTRELWERAKLNYFESGIDASLSPRDYIRVAVANERDRMRSLAEVTRTAYRLLFGDPRE